MEGEFKPVTFALTTLSEYLERLIFVVWNRSKKPPRQMVNRYSRKRLLFPESKLEASRIYQKQMLLFLITKSRGMCYEYDAENIRTVVVADNPRAEYVTDVAGNCYRCQGVYDIYRQKAEDKNITDVYGKGLIYEYENSNQAVKRIP